MACGHIKVSIKSKRLCMTYAQRLNMLMKNMQNGPVWVYIRFRQIGTYFIYIQIRQMLSKLLMFSIKAPS